MASRNQPKDTSKLKAPKEAQTNKEAQTKAEVEADAKAKTAVKPQADKDKAGADAKAKKEEKRQMVAMVTASKPRRRAGMRFGPVPTPIYDGDLDDKQIKAIMDDPILSISEPKE